VPVTVPAQPPALSTETARLHEATRHRVVKAASDPAHSAATTTAGKPAATPRAAAPAWVVDLAAEVEVRTPAAVPMAVVDTIDRICHSVAEIVRA
jgi:hypothetical protein